MSASIIGVKVWSTATPQEIESAVKSAASGPRTFNGQKLYETLNTRENPWRKPSGDDEAVCIWNYPTGNSCDIFLVDTVEGEQEAVLFFDEKTGLPDAFCILEPHN